MAWNVQGAFPPNGNKKRIRNQIEFIEMQAGLPQILLLNEVTAVQREFWHDLLRDELGYREIVDTLDWARQLDKINVPPHQDLGHSNGNLIAIHEESEVRNLTRRSPSISEDSWENSDQKYWDTNFPEKILNAEVEYADSAIDLWNIRTVPGSMYGEEKIKILENTYNRIAKEGKRLRILAGDLNAPKEELADGTVIPWRVDNEGPLRDRWVAAELNIFSGLEEFGMVDVFRHIHGYGDLDTADVSFQSKRFDHLFASAELNPVNCYYDHDGFDCSDHAPIIAEFGL